MRIFAVTKIQSTEPMPRGRNRHLIEQRALALVRRYHYWTEEQRLRFDDTLKILSEQEFFLSEERIMAIIRRASRVHRELGIRPVPKVRKPRITAPQLAMLQEE